MPDVSHRLQMDVAAIAKAAPPGRGRTEQPRRRRAARKQTKNKRSGGRGGGAEKYSRFLPPPLRSAGHDCDGKPETKPLQQQQCPSKAALPLTSGCVGTPPPHTHTRIRRHLQLFSPLYGALTGTSGPEGSSVFSASKGLTCISWFTLNFGMKPRLTPGKQCSL